MSGFSSIVGLSKIIADTLYEVINAVSTHAATNVSADVHKNASRRINDCLPVASGNWSQAPAPLLEVSDEMVCNFVTPGLNPTGNAKSNVDIDLGANFNIGIKFRLIVSSDAALAYTTKLGYALPEELYTILYTNSDAGSRDVTLEFPFVPMRYINFCIERNGAQIETVSNLSIRCFIK